MSSHVPSLRLIRSIKNVASTQTLVQKKFQTTDNDYWTFRYSNFFEKPWWGVPVKTPWMTMNLCNRQEYVQRERAQTVENVLGHLNSVAHSQRALIMPYSAYEIEHTTAGSSCIGDARSTSCAPLAATAEATQEGGCLNRTWAFYADTDKRTLGTLTLVEWKPREELTQYIMAINQPYWYPETLQDMSEEHLGQLLVQGFLTNPRLARLVRDKI